MLCIFKCGLMFISGYFDSLCYYVFLDVFLVRLWLSEIHVTETNVGPHLEMHNMNVTQEGWSKGYVSNKHSW
jgi:hypothetical protein